MEASGAGDLAVGAHEAVTAALAEVRTDAVACLAVHTTYVCYSQQGSREKIY
jgi:hypothetical protein